MKTPDRCGRRWWLPECERTSAALLTFTKTRKTKALDKRKIAASSMATATAVLEDYWIMETAAVADDPRVVLSWQAD
jgi:hypothetical protein